MFITDTQKADGEFDKYMPCTCPGRVACKLVLWGVLIIVIAIIHCAIGNRLIILHLPKHKKVQLLLDTIIISYTYSKVNQKQIHS